MPGIKRKLSNKQNRQTGPDNPATTERNAPGKSVVSTVYFFCTHIFPDTQGTESGYETRRSSRAAAAAAAAARDGVSNAPTPNDQGTRSRILILNTGNAPRGGESRNSRGRLSTRSRTSARQEPETPSTKRAEKEEPVNETPRSTRQSVRLKIGSSHENGDAGFSTPQSVQIQPSSSVAAASDSKPQRGKRKSLHDDTSNNSIPSSAINNNATGIKMRLRGNTMSGDASHRSSVSHQGKAQKSSPELEQEHGVPGDEASATEESPKSRRLSGISLGKRKSTQIEPNNLSAAVSSAKEKRKREFPSVDLSLEEQLQNSPYRETEDHSSYGVTPAGPASEVGSHVETAPISNAEEKVTASQSQGGQGGKITSNNKSGRSRGRRAARTKGVAAARRRTRVPPTRNETDSDSDIEFDRHSPPPGETVNRLRDRQRELDRAFKKVTLAQGLALNVLMERSLDRLVKDKYIHEKVPEWNQVQQYLDRRHEKYRGISYNFYKYQVEQQNRVYAVVKERTEQQFKVSRGGVTHCPYLTSRSQLTTTCRNAHCISGMNTSKLHRVRIWHSLRAHK